MLSSKKQLEKLGKRYRGFTDEPQDRNLLFEYRNFRSQNLPDILRDIEPALHGSHAVLSARAKRVDTIVRKLRREGTMQLPSMADIVGLRIVVASPDEQYKLLTALQSLPVEIASIRDYVKEPQDSGYRGIHVIGVVEQLMPSAKITAKFTYEVQIRTPYQHIWSTLSESYGEQVKEGGGPESIRNFLSSLSENIEAYEGGHTEEQQLVIDSTGSGSKFAVLLFDKKMGQRTSLNIYPDFAEALAAFSFYESQNSRNLNTEVVFLSANHPQEVFEVTHPRYFNYQGRPNIPDAILGDLTLPAV